MRRQPILVMAATLFVISAARSDDAKDDLGKFQGTWRLVSAESNGKKTPAEEARKIVLTIKGNSFVLKKGDATLSEGTFKLYPDRKPKAIEEMLTAGPSKGKTFHAIYEIDDTHHKICFAAAGKPRPTEFSAPPGSGRLLQLWKR